MNQSLCYSLIISFMNWFASLPVKLANARFSLISLIHLSLEILSEAKHEREALVDLKYLEANLFRQRSADALSLSEKCASLKSSSV